MPPAPAAVSNVAGPGLGSVIPTAPPAGAQTSQSTTSPLLTTSAQSRTTTANNVATLNTGINNIAAGNAAQGATLNGKPVSGAPGGPVNAGPGASSAPSITVGADGTTTIPMGGGYGQVGSQSKPATDTTNTPSDTAAKDGTDGISSAVSGLPPSLQKLYSDNLTQLSEQQQQAKSVLTQAQATLANDPAATAAINAISAKWDVLIQGMEAKNKQVLGRAGTSVAAFGGLGIMNQSFLSDQMDAATQRVSSLISQQQAAVLNAQAAFGKQDLAAFNTAMDNYNKSITSMNTALSDLSTATDKAVKDQQAQAKIDAAAQKQSVAQDISLSSNLGTAIAKNLADAGITDPKQMQDYISQMAQQYGITDPAILQSAVDKAQQAATKATDAHANTVSTINKRNQPKAATGGEKGGTDAGYTYTPEDVTAAKEILQNGGNGYAGAGSDAYSDPGAYMSLLNSWVHLKGTAAGFAKVFPVKRYINPASYSLLPAAIQPKAAAATTAQFSTSN